MKYLRMVVLSLSTLVFSTALLLPVKDVTGGTSIDTVAVKDSLVVNKSIPTVIEEKPKTKKITHRDSLTVRTLFKLVKSMGVKHPDIITAQALEETGYFKSSLFKRNGNLFGMKKAGSRPTTACGIIGGYANYKCHTDYILYSVMDRVMLDAAFYRNLSKEAYYAKLSRTYASNPNYVRNLKKIISKHGINFNN